MEKHFVISLAVISVWYLLFMTPFVLVTTSAILAFIFLGMVPFVGYTIPAEIMFLGYMTAGAALVIFAKERGYYPGSPQLVKAIRRANAQEIRRYNRRIARLDIEAQAMKRNERSERIKSASTARA